MKTNAKIYVMRAEDGTLKLGHSKSPIRRSKELGRLVEIVHETDVLEHVEKIERLAHRVLALHGKHLRGEWFEAQLDDAIRAIEVATRQAEAHELPLGGSLSVHSGPRKKPLAMKLDADLLARLDAYLGTLDVAVTRTAFIEVAVRKFLDAREFGESAEAARELHGQFARSKRGRAT